MCACVCVCVRVCVCVVCVCVCVWARRRQRCSLYQVFLSEIEAQGQGTEKKHQDLTQKLEYERVGGCSVSSQAGVGHVCVVVGCG
jgi:hypothetical protein